MDLALNNVQSLICHKTHTTRRCPCGVMVKAMDCRIVEIEFVLQSRYYVHFRANTLGKGMNPLILPAITFTFGDKADNQTILVNSSSQGGCPRGVRVKAMDCGIVVSEFVLQSRYYVHFRANTLGKGMNLLILPAMG